MPCPPLFEEERHVSEDVQGAGARAGQGTSEF